MRFRIEFTPSAYEDLRCLRAFEQRIVLAAMRDHLQNDADQESSRRKQLRPNELAPWELKFGRYRVFYRPAHGTVQVIAVGQKEHNDLYIRGERVEL